MVKVWNRFPKINILEIKLLFIINADSIPIVKVANAIICFFLLSFLDKIGMFSVSAGAYIFIIAIPKTQIIAINIHLVINPNTIILLRITVPQ